ncbi:MAG: HAD hydrolase-like protein [Thermodesulfobacteriota bacterium]|nr:HAD hydrolase-like protein [Thermodesulfobacteriota bacterium]
MDSKGLIVFDMDGVLVDVSKSYRDTVRQTARLFFKGAGSWKNLPDPLFSLTDLARVKQSGGLNNDWDLTFLVISLLFTLVKSPTDQHDPDPWIRHNKVISSCDVTALSQFLNSTKNPVASLLKKKGQQKHEFITGLFTGDVGSGNIIKQIFQEIYLGKEMFEATYGIPARIYHEKGYINREKLLVDRSILKSLSKNHILAIATGRPKAEADYPLDFFGLRKFFNVIYTLDDCIKEEQKIYEKEKKRVSLSKPNPYILDAVAKIHKHNVSGFYYVGDMPDDMVAASRSGTGFAGIGILISSSDKDTLKEDLLQAGADYIIEDFEDLKNIIPQK